MSDGSAHLQDRASLREHRAALHAFQGTAADVSARSLGALERAGVEVQRAVERWAAKRAEAQRELAAARRALSACEADPRPHSCAAEAAARAAAEKRLASAEDNLAAARRCQGRLRAATVKFRREAAVYRGRLDRELAAAAAFLGGLAAAADAYAGSSLGGGGSAAAFAAAAHSGGNPAAPAPPTVGSTDLAEVPLDRIDLGDSGVSGPESFRKTTYATMREGTQRLDEVVLPAVRDGADGDYFARLDRERGLDYEHGYQRIYDAFFGDESLRLDARADGAYGVTNGYHRIFVALEMGLRTLPARISRRRS